METERIRLSFCSMKYKPVTNPFAEGTGFINSIFEKGMCISTPGPLNVSDIVQADFSLPGLENNVITQLQVVWVKDEMVGLEFIDSGRRNAGGDHGQEEAALGVPLSDYIQKLSRTDLRLCYLAMQDHFTYRLAECERDRQEIYRLRYLIYVLEHPWEPANDSGLERDVYDPHAVHFMVQDRNGAAIATSRILRPDGKRELPVETHFQVDVTSGFRFSPAEVCEISRYCVAREYRRHIEDSTPEWTSSGAEAGGPRDRLKYRSPSLLMNFFKLMYRYSREHGIRGWYMVIESRLANTLRGAGLDLVKVGEPRNYHGLRTPYLLDLEKIGREVSQINPALSTCLNEG